MKKRAILVCAVLLAAFLVTPVMAQQNVRPSQFAITVGGYTDDGFEYFYWTAGAEMNLFLGDNLMITPEAMFLGYKFDFDWFWLQPGATLNLLFGKPGNQMFAGGGILISIPIEPSEAESDLILKLNGGFLTDSMKLTVYINTALDDLFGDFILGASIGFILF